MKVIWWIAIVIFGIALALVIAGQLGLLRGSVPQDLGVKDGKLKPPARTPNSVSSQADLYPDHPQAAYARIDALHYEGDGQAALAKLAKLLAGQARTVVVQQTADYVYAQSTTALLRFTDDVEFWLNPEKQQIEVRSASRIGRKDFNVNRERVEMLRSLLAQP
jgi:uncharacterized protein (DUF1499 family)